MQAEYQVAAGDLEDAAEVIAHVEQRLAEGEERLAAVFLPVARAALERALGNDTAAESTLRNGIVFQEQLAVRGPQLRTATALARLLCDHDRPDETRDAGTIRIVDARFLLKDSDNEVVAVRVSDLDDNEREDLRAAAGALVGLGAGPCSAGRTAPPPG